LLTVPWSKFVGFAFLTLSVAVVWKQIFGSIVLYPVLVRYDFTISLAWVASVDILLDKNIEHGWQLLF